MEYIGIDGLKRTKYCGLFSQDDVGKEVVAMGWVAKQRDLGNLIFIDLRDRTGIVQLAFGDETDRAIFDKASICRSEFVLAAKGIVRERSNKNPDIKTGSIEIFVSELRILSKSDVPPFEISDQNNTNIDLRLRYRYLDLRRGEMQKTLWLRHKIVKAARDYFDDNGFIEIETPMLVKSTPEGARDYLVPSRVHKGKFYALPQSPQLYKQLLMLAGYDRYFQVTRCFRDEDLRADRQPEFTQIDLEMSFVDQNDVMDINEGFIKTVFKNILDIDLKTPFLKMSYDEAMNRFGSDKPDVRFGLELVDLTSGLKSTEFKVFANAAKSGSIRAINFKDGAEKVSRKEIDKLIDFVKTYKAKGLAYTKILDGKRSSSYEKFLKDEEIAFIDKAVDAQDGDLILIVADSDNRVVFDSLGALRIHLGNKYELFDKDEFAFLWVTEFPLLEYNDEQERYVAKHHPFTSVLDSDVELLETSPEKCRAKAYDLVLNGCELGGGSIRINNRNMQDMMFKALGFSEQEAQEKFGFLLDAFKYGAPPHGGMAYGLDRLVMLMLKKDSIRDVIAFPKVQNAGELMTQCPAQVEKTQLDELNVKIIED